ncbi:MAG: hypothetical protein WB902_13095 [Acetobacteraceae bacterium]
MAVATRAAWSRDDAGCLARPALGLDAKQLHPHGPRAVDQGNGGIVAAGEVLGRVADRAERDAHCVDELVVDGTG